MQKIKKAICLAVSLIMLCTANSAVFARSLSSKPFNPDFHLSNVFEISDLAVQKYDFENFEVGASAVSAGFNSLNNVTDASVADDNGNKVISIKSTRCGKCVYEISDGRP